jgi:DNA-binding transcriptional regulator YhcF (GntR family)
MQGVMLAQNDVQDYLRRRLIADLHLGRLKPGDRAPSLRTVASELSVGIRAVSRAYSQLAQEGLVLIRGRSGVYIAPTASLAPQLSEPQAWYSSILTDAWRRRIPLPQLPELFERFVSRRLRCTCIESTEDHMVAFCAELDEDFGLDTLALRLEASGSETTDQIKAAVATTDFVVTTAFHAADVRPIAQHLGKPVVIVSVNEAIVNAIQNKLAERPVVILVSDRRFVERVERYLVDAFAEHGRLRVALIDDFLRNGGNNAEAETMVTRAARKQINEPEYHLVAESIPFLSLDAAREITQCMIAVHDSPRALQPA